ncbi:extracellular serine proteinase-like [Saccoglossus kowalevskii]|uniref:Proprotein convertase subtilisin/kexin type 9-related309 n=1 Tax=Saccoglossus kowalevskii TaxID=10224 RepID=A0A0U2L5T8_SACKO|nr:proprotein convertase subtilisin/kexin type 9-related309 [Saccoglossus kowalevskii]
MKLFTVLTIVAVCLIAWARSKKPFIRKVSDWVEGEYIVVFKDEIVGDVATATEAIMKKLDPLDLKLAKVNRVFNKAINGAVIQTMNVKSIDLLESMASELGIAYIEQDAKVKPAEIWNLDRIDQTSNILDGTFNPSGDGTGVNVYLVDTGIYTDYSNFANEPTDWIDIYSGRKAPVKGDCNGHGTHMAGTIGSMTYGVAKNVNLLSVRIFDCNGDTTWGYVIDALEYILANSNPNIPSVINLSLSGGVSDAANAAVNKLYDAGILPIVAAGNGGINSCETSPASAEKALVVGGLGQADEQVFNYGQCVDVIAPAINIESLNFERTRKIPSVIASGTSSAAAHVTGAAAIILQNNPNWTPVDVENFIKSTATTVTGLDNPILYVY